MNVLHSVSLKIFFYISASKSRIPYNSLIDECADKCLEFNNPVCGNDGKNYPSSCDLECTRDRFMAKLRVIYEGRCQPCVCPKLLREVCGSDGFTYPNECQLKCVRKHDSNLSVFREGRCE